MEKGLRKNYYMQEYLEGYHFNNEIIKDCGELLQRYSLDLFRKQDFQMEFKEGNSFNRLISKLVTLTSKGKVRGSSRKR